MIQSTNYLKSISFTNAFKYINLIISKSWFVINKGFACYPSDLNTFSPLQGFSDINWRTSNLAKIFSHLELSCITIWKLYDKFSSLLSRRTELRIKSNFWYIMRLFKIDGYPSRCIVPNYVIIFVFMWTSAAIGVPIISGVIAN